MVLILDFPSYLFFDYAMRGDSVHCPYLILYSIFAARGLVEKNI